MSDLLMRLETLEAAVTYTEPPPPGDISFRYTPGRLPLLISAPHGAAHQRRGHTKQEDEYTSAFARLLAECTGAHVFYSWAQSDDDPNWDRESPYKTYLAQIATAHDIRFVMDIHGMSNRHKFGIAIGTMGGASCTQHHKSLITGQLMANGFRPATVQETRDFPTLEWDRFVINHHRFTGGLTSHTVTRYAAEVLGIHAAQFELCASLRIVRRRATERWPGDFRGDPDGIARAVAAFESMIIALALTGG